MTYGKVIAQDMPYEVAEADLCQQQYYYIDGMVFVHIREYRSWGKTHFKVCLWESYTKCNSP